MDRQTPFREAFPREARALRLSENVPPFGPVQLRHRRARPTSFSRPGRRRSSQTAVALAVAEKYPFYVIGGGNNLLFDDAGYRGLLIRNRLEGSSGRKAGPERSLGDGPRLRPAARPSTAGLTGLEFLAGIPGTVGGAVYGNAGAYGWSIGDVLETATVLRPGGERKTMTREDLRFGYRDSALKKGERGIVFSAVLLCSPGDSRESEAKIRRDPREEADQTPSPGHGLRRELFQELLLRDRGTDRRRPAARAGRRPGPGGGRRGRLREPLQFHHQQGERRVARRPRPGRRAQGQGLQDLRRPSRGGGHLPSSRRFNALTRPAGSPLFSASRRICFPRTA